VRRLVVFVLVALAAAGCGHASKRRAETQATTTSQATTTNTVTTVPATEAAVRVYFLRDGKVAPVLRRVPSDRPATWALNQLAGGPTAAEGELGNDYRGGVLLKRIASGTATIELVANLSHAALAQVVYTLTQFPTVQRVQPTRSLGKPLTRATFEDVTPAILVESPLPGERVTSPLQVRGTANTFEATFTLEIRNESNRTLSREIVTATSGSGTRGTFDTTISFNARGPISLVAYEPSAENGQPLHTVRIPLVAAAS
jgi:germination protein M